MFEEQISIKDEDKCVKLSDYKKVNITPELSQRIQERIKEIYDNWYEKNDDLFYYKEKVYVRPFLNELVGVEISKYMGLPTVLYDIVSRYGEIDGLISKNFKDDGRTYLKSFLLNPAQGERMKKVLLNPDYEVDEEFRKKLTFYLYSNFFMAINDRMWNSLCVVENENIVDIAPIHDYESICLFANTLFYDDPLISYDFSTKRSVRELLNRNEYAKEASEMIANIDLLDLIRKIEDTYQLEIPKYYFYEFSDFERIRKKVLKSNKII